MSKKNNGRKIRFSSSEKYIGGHFTKSKYPYSDVLGSYTGTPSAPFSEDLLQDMYPVQDADDL